MSEEPEEELPYPTFTCADRGHALDAATAAATLVSKSSNSDDSSNANEELDVLVEAMQRRYAVAADGDCNTATLQRNEVAYAEFLEQAAQSATVWPQCLALCSQLLRRTRSVLRHVART